MKKYKMIFFFVVKCLSPHLHVYLTAATAAAESQCILSKEKKMKKKNKEEAFVIENPLELAYKQKILRLCTV